jgi:hypothetical protein
MLYVGIVILALGLAMFFGSQVIGHGSHEVDISSFITDECKLDPARLNYVGQDDDGVHYRYYKMFYEYTRDDGTMQPIALEMTPKGEPYKVTC